MAHGGVVGISFLIKKKKKQYYNTLGMFGRASALENSSGFRFSSGAAYLVELKPF